MHGDQEEKFPFHEDHSINMTFCAWQISIIVFPAPKILFDTCMSSVCRRDFSKFNDLLYTFGVFLVSINVIKDVLSGSNLPANDVIPKYHRECQFVILYERKNVLTKMHLVTFSMEAATKWAFGLQAMLKRKGMPLCD